MSLKSLIASYVREKYPRTVHAGDIERFAMQNGKMGGNGTRRARELANEGILERIPGHEAQYLYIFQENEVAPPRETIKMF